MFACAQYFCGNINVYQVVLSYQPGACKTYTLSLRAALPWTLRSVGIQDVRGRFIFNNSNHNSNNSN